MKRRLFTIVSALSLLLFVAVVLIWADGAAPRQPKPREWMFGNPYSMLHVGYDHHSIAMYLGDITATTAPITAVSGRDWGGVHWARIVGSSGQVQYQFRVVHGLAFVLTAPLPASWGVLAWWRSSVRRRRRLAGQCPFCGYDLRASKDRCPECGEAIPAKVGA